MKKGLFYIGYSTWRIKELKEKLKKLAFNEVKKGDLKMEGKKDTCEYCCKKFEDINRPQDHYRRCDMAKLARYKATVNLAMDLDDTESIHNILEPLNKET